MDDIPVSNLWRRESLEYNPYYRTAFHAIGITPDETSLQAIGEYAEDRLNAVARDPKLYTLGADPLTAAIIVKARQRLFDPDQRILEELLIQPSVQPAQDQLSAIRQQLLDALPSIPLACRFDFLHAVIREYSEMELPPVDVPPFPVDQTLVPPFGLDDEEDVP